MLTRIDRTILDRFEKFSHWTQRMFGWDCFHWAEVFALLSAGTFARRVFRAVTKPEEGMVVLDMILALCYLWFACYGTTHHRVATRDGFLNPMRERGMVVRLMFVLFAVLEMAEVARTGRSFRIAAFTVPEVWYFVGCTPLPPGKSRVREFLESLNLRPVSVGV